MEISSSLIQVTLDHSISGFNTFVLMLSTAIFIFAKLCVLWIFNLPANVSKLFDIAYSKCEHSAWSLPLHVSDFFLTYPLYYM